MSLNADRKMLLPMQRLPHSMQRLQMTIVTVLVHIPMMKSVMRMIQWQSCSVSQGERQSSGGNLHSVNAKEWQNVWKALQRNCILTMWRLLLMLPSWMERSSVQKASTRRVQGR